MVLVLLFTFILAIPSDCGSSGTHTLEYDAIAEELDEQNALEKQNTLEEEVLIPDSSEQSSLDSSKAQISQKYYGLMKNSRGQLIINCKLNHICDQKCSDYSGTKNCKVISKTLLTKPASLVGETLISIGSYYEGCFENVSGQNAYRKGYHNRFNNEANAKGNSKDYTDAINNLRYQFLNATENCIKATFYPDSVGGVTIAEIDAFYRKAFTTFQDATGISNSLNGEDKKKFFAFANAVSLNFVDNLDTYNAGCNCDVFTGVIKETIDMYTMPMCKKQLC